MYELAQEAPNRNIEYELIQYGEIRDKNAPIGDLLSRMWGHFGKPKKILFEGFIYNVRDRRTALEFVVSFGASGPAYYGEKEYIERLKPIILEFEKFLTESENADCEIEVETDFGIYLCGAKNGVPYDREKQEIEEQSVLSSGSTGNQHYDELVFDVKKYLENNRKENQSSIRQIDVDECITYLNAYVITVGRSKTLDEKIFALKMTVIALNNLNKRCENTLIVNNAKEKIIEIINLVIRQNGYNLSTEDLTLEWREW